MRKPPTLKRLSSGLNYFTNQMKFKPVSQDSDATPNEKPKNPKKLDHQKTLVEQSENDSLTEESNSASSSENLASKKSPNGDMKADFIIGN